MNENLEQVGRWHYNNGILFLGIPNINNVVQSDVLIFAALYLLEEQYDFGCHRIILSVVVLISIENYRESFTILKLVDLEIESSCVLYSFSNFEGQLEEPCYGFVDDSGDALEKS